MNRRVSRPVWSVHLLAAGAVILSVFLAPFESLLPDAHDRGASVASAQAVPGPGIAARDVAFAKASQPLDGSSFPTKGHPFRVDHCNHSHYLSVGTRATGTMVESHTFTPGSSSPKLVGVLLSPRHRPPIA
jgi:hypothetical protein